MSNPLGTQTQSSMLTVDSFSNIFSDNQNEGGSGKGTNRRTIMNAIIVTAVCCIIFCLGLILLGYCCIKRQRQPSELHSRRPRGSLSTRDKMDALPLTPDSLPVQKPLVVANQYTNHQHHLPPRPHPEDYKSASALPVIASRSEDLALRLPLVDPLSDRLRVLQQDSSSERDSGTGDSRKSRDNLDEVDLASPISIMSPPAKAGGGESTISLTEFEETDLTRLDYHDLDDEDETGCGEAILSASNSIVSSENCSSVSAASGSRKASKPEEAATDPTSVAFRTFQPHRSMSRDFLNCSPVRMASKNNLKKRSSAIELNGENYLVITDEPPHPQSQPLDPQAYRGGTSKSSNPLNRGLEVNEKLLEYSLNTTDYSLHQSQLVRNQSRLHDNGGSSLVNSLPRNRRSQRNRRLSHKQAQASKAKDPDQELYTTVGLKDDKLF